MKTTIISFLLSVLSFAISGQDILIVGQLESKSIKCKIISSNEGSLKYFNFESGDTSKILISSIHKIILGPVDEIFLTNMKQLMIPCIIESIGIHYFRYHDNQTGLINNICKDNVFACQFGDTCINNKLEEYFAEYSKKVFHPGDANKMTIIKKNALSVIVKNLQFENSVVSFSIVNGERVINTYMNCADIDQIYFGSESIHNILKHGEDFILTREGNIFNNCTIKRITNSQIFFTSNKDEIEREVSAPKDRICAILFYDFEKAIKNPDKN
jgi:hypothetical protein